ncbi:Gfo/Idh/MocA family protein [Paenibacillus cremeus]|uniref:Gfo/Idh/MocA family oxidoreductase n=1 Tax=Paenibacillus cremeus TaxID=2163881 RepID=A0A559K9U8_9BACL|nr:Gfo/Idh/MocA family oxidoreductase [Paenibacillus cremeus]TVY08863.1 Gfo/Idh/MocA family oxidoreductase [Paenibacillus cremeus]
MQPMGQIHLGIIGCGKVTVARHLPSIKAVGDPTVRLVAMADAVPGLARQVADEHGIALAFDDYRELIAMNEINAVSICTPAFTHRQIAIDCLRAGKHVYLEKPAALNEAEMLEILAVSKETDRVFIVGSNGLLQPQMFVFKNMIEQGQLGEVYNIGVSRTASRGESHSRKSFSSDGGVRMESASHNVEWALFFLGDPKPVAVTATGYYKYDNLSILPHEREAKETQDAIMALIQFDNGTSFSYSAIRAAAAPPKYELTIQGDLGQIRYDVNKCYQQKSNECVDVYTQNEEGQLVASKPIIECGRTHAAMYEHFFQCIHEGQASPVSNGERSAVVMRVLDALKLSIERGGKQIELN